MHLEPNKSPWQKHSSNHQDTNIPRKIFLCIVEQFSNQ